MPLTHYCPVCWQEIAGTEEICPSCGYDLSKDQELSFEEKLISALDHPVPAKRLLAIQILGDLRSLAALPALEKILTDENRDIYELLEALLALSKIPGQQSQSLIVRASLHPYALVRHEALRLLRSKFKELGT